MTSQVNLKRRHFLIGAAGATTLAATGQPFAQEAQNAQTPLPDYVDWKEPDALIVHSARTLETRRGAIGTSLVTPNEILYIRNNLPAPSPQIVADPDAWTVEFEGFNSPRDMSVAELKTLEVKTVVAVLQCSGNGRAFFSHETSGTQWETGAAGCVFWSGVPVRAIVEALGGVSDGAQYLTGTGGEELPDGLPPETVMVERSVPKQVMDTAILAWEMNGEPVPLAHGGPLRLVIPGYYGVNNVKYIKKLAFTKDQSPAKIQQTSYRVRPVGVKGAPDQPSMFEMSVKSWITGPLKDASTGRIQIHGVAMGGVNKLKRVEVSTDGGHSWQTAEFVGPDLGKYAWRPFVLFADLAPGTYTLCSKATDINDDAQPEHFAPNERGYGNNGWRVHSIDLTVS